MGIFKLFCTPQSGFSSSMMIEIATEWSKVFVKDAPTLFAITYNYDEIYMFCCWILLDYGKNYGYLNKNSDINRFFETIFQAVKNTGEYDQSDMDQFMFRVSQYESEIGGMLKCDYPRTPMFFPEILFARFTEVDFTKKRYDSFQDMDDLICFSDYFGSFWNKVNRDLMERFPKRK